MKKLFFLLPSFMICSMVFCQTNSSVQKSISKNVDKNINEDFETPPSYGRINMDENQNIDIVVMYKSLGDSLQIIKGPEKYKKEIINICKTYSKILDSLKFDRINKISKDSLYTEKKIRDEKYKDYDGGYEGYLDTEEDIKILNVINKFLKIDGISSRSIFSSKGGPEVFDFYYYRTITDTNGTKKIIHGKVTWTDN